MGKNIVLAAGWMLALILGGVWYMESQTVQGLEDRLAESEQAYESVQEAAAQVDALEAKCTMLEETVARLAAASEADTAASAPSDGTEVPAEFDPGALVQSMLGGGKTEAGEPGGGGAKKRENPFTSMFEGEDGEKLMESVLPMQVDMQYGALFQELDLPADRKAALRAALLDHARGGMAAGMAFMRGEDAPEDAAMPTDEDLLAAVGEILSPEELAEFSAYQEELPERMLRQQYDMQMGMMAGDVPEEVRAITVDVLVENMLAVEEAQESAMQPDFEAMRAAFDNTLVQLDQALTPEEVERVRPFIEQQRAGIDMAVSMFGFGEDEEDAP